MLGIDVSKIKKMNVISESTVERLSNLKIHTEIFRRKIKGNKKNKVAATTPAPSAARPGGRSNKVFVQFELALNANNNAGRNSEEAEKEWIKEQAGKIVQALDDGTLVSALSGDDTSGSNKGFGVEANEVAMAIPPKDAETPAWYDDATNEALPGATIAEQVGLDPDNPELTIEEVVEVVEEVLEVQIDEVETYQDQIDRQEELLDESDDMLVLSSVNPVSIALNETNNVFPADFTWSDGQVVSPPLVVNAFEPDGVDGNGDPQFKIITSSVKNPLDPWKVEVYLITSSPGMTLGGETECAFEVTGDCSFDKLIINGVGDIMLGFRVSSQGEDTLTEDEVVIDDVEVDKVIVAPTTTVGPTTTQGAGTTNGPGPGTTTASTTVDPTATTATTTTAPPQDKACTIKKNKQIVCVDRNLTTGRNLAIQIMKLSTKARKKVKKLDVSHNPNLSQETLQAIMKQLPGLTSVTAQHMGWEKIPPNFFFGLNLKKIDVSFNHLKCVRDAFDGLAMKQLIFKNNIHLQNTLDGASKAKKKKIPEALKEFNRMPAAGCNYH